MKFFKWGCFCFLSFVVEVNFSPEVFLTKPLTQEQFQTNPATNQQQKETGSDLEHLDEQIRLLRLVTQQA